MDIGSLLSLTAFLTLNILAALSGAFFRPGRWYDRLLKPFWRPPNWLFGPAWSVLYTLNAVAGWLVFEQVGIGWPITLYLVSLALNAGWSAIFFGLRRINLAFGWILALWASIAVVVAAFAPISTTATWLLAPYLAWVSFAAALNLAIWRLNRETSAAGA